MPSLLSSIFYNSFYNYGKGRRADQVIADIISTVEFDHTGDYLATGDKGGRVVLFERNEQVGRVHMCIWLLARR